MDSVFKKSILNTPDKTPSKYFDSPDSCSSNIKISSSRNSISPSSLEKNYDLRHENLPESSKSTNHECFKPVSLIIIEKYFSDVCHSLSSKGLIDTILLSKASTMQDVLKDCLKALPNLSLQFYVLMGSALKEIQQIHFFHEENLYPALSKKLVQLGELLQENSYSSEIQRVNTQQSEEIVSETIFLEDLGNELFMKISKVTTKVLNT